MIKFFDAVVLAHTKLRTHKIRTGIAIGVAGILFGLILGVIFVVQGAFDSLDRFSKEGLSDRAVVSIMHSDVPVRIYQLDRDKEFIAEVEVQHAKQVAIKQAAAKKHSIPYEPLRDDPTPILIDDETKGKFFQEMGHPAVLAAAELRKKPSTFNIREFVKPYGPSEVKMNNKVLQNFPDGAVNLMKDGVEFSDDKNIPPVDDMGRPSDRTLQIMSQSLVDPFINKGAKFDPSKGEIPVVLPVSDAEKLLGLKPLEKDATTKDKRDRLNEIRTNIGEATAAYCYRNVASQQLISEAKSQQDSEKKNGKKPGYRDPELRYNLPADDSCGAVTIRHDKRTAQQKQMAERQIAFEKEIGAFIGEPEQHKLTLRGVGITGDSPSFAAGSFSVGSMVQGILGSWLGYDMWTIPADMLKQLPQEARPGVLFDSVWSDTSDNAMNPQRNPMQSYLVEFESTDDARAFMKAHEVINFSDSADRVMVMPFGSSVVLIDDMKNGFTTILLWTLLIVGGVAAIIMGSIIGRTVSEGRRESAIFRAIGARRSDVGSIYGMYAFLLSVRVCIFAVALALILALGVEIWLSADATIAAQYAYAAMETTKTFNFFSPFSIYVPIVIGVILASGMIASIIPVIASARRNPIRDMRDDT